MYSLPQLKLFVKKKTADTVGDTTEFTVAVDNDKPSTSVKVGTKTPSDCYWDLRLTIGILYQMNG